MKCRKCGHENPSDTLYCEECGHRKDQPVKMERAIPPMYIALIGAALGIFAVVAWFFEVFYAAIGLGAVGMIVGGYSMTFVRITDSEKNDKMIVLVLTAVAICTSVIGFLFGIYGLV